MSGGYRPLNQESDDHGLLDDILQESTSVFTFDPSSYFDDWFDEPATASAVNVVESSSGDEEVKQSPSYPRNGGKLVEFQSQDVVMGGEEEIPEYTKPTKVHSTDSEGSGKRKGKKKTPPPMYSENPPFPVPYGDESLGYRDSAPYRGGTLPYEDEGDDLSYDHYELVQAGVEPSTFSPKRFPRQVDLADSGVVMDIMETSPYLTKMSHEKYIDDSSTSMSKQSFDIAMSDDDTAKKARWCLVCLKTYCVIFMLTIISLSIYVAADLGDFTTDAKVAKKELQEAQTRGYKELRLGGRRVYYRIKESEGMANHTVLLIHSENSSGEMFNKLGTLDFLSAHGARAVAIDMIGYGKSDPPIHIPETYEGFFAEIVSLFELEYNLILVCVETGCEKLLPYYLHHGVYRQDNSFIEGAVFISPRGTTYSNFVDPAKSHMNTATRTVVVSGSKDQFVNMEVNEQLDLIPRCEIHALPDLKNNFYSNKHSKLYFHAALQAFMEGLAYEYDRELEEISQHEQSNEEGSGTNPNLGNMNNQYGYNNQNQSQYQVPRPQGGDAFSRFQAKQNPEQDTFQDLGYNPAHRFSRIKGEK